MKQRSKEWKSPFVRRCFLLEGGDAGARMAGKRISPEQVIKELVAIGFARVPDYIVIEDGDVQLRKKLKPLERAAIASIEKTSTGIKIKFYDKMKALELLGKHFGTFSRSGSICAVTLSAIVNANVAKS